MENIYLHAICPQYEIFDTDETLEKLEQILKTRYLLSRRLLGYLDPSKGGFNGLDYISLCDYDNRNAAPYNNDKNYLGYNSYHCYVEKSLSLIINKDKIKAIKPVLIAPTVFDYNSMEEMRILGFSKTTRYSDMPDEVQVKGRISLSDLEGFTIPTGEIMKFYKNERDIKRTIMELISGIDELLIKYKYMKNIYDLDSFAELRTEDDVEKLIRKAH